MAVSESQARQEFREHWTLVLAAAVGFSFNSVMAAATGLFMAPLGEEFGWSRTLQSSGVSIASAVVFFFSPFFGVLIDRIGTRRLAIPGIAAMALVIASMSLLNGSPLQWIAIWTVYAFAALLTKTTIWTAAVQSVFDAGRGLALGLTLAGSAVAQTITPALANYLINTFGWRHALVWLGFGWGGIALTVCFLWLFDGYDKSRRASIANRETQGQKVPLLDAPGLSLAEAWHSPALWRIGISTFLIMVVTIALNVHQFPILVEAGIDRTSAAYYAGVAGIAGIIGKLVTGSLLDRYPGRWVGSLTIGVTAVTFILLLLPNRTPAIIITAMFVNGYAAGSKLQIASYLTAAYGGMRNFGGIFGTISSLIAGGSGLGPLIGGLVYDMAGNYDPFLIFGIIGTLFSAYLIFGLGDYPDWKKDAGSPET